MSLITQSPPTADPTLTTHDMNVWKPAVDGILRRYNDEAQRAEAGAAAVLLLQAMSTMGVFNHVTVIPAPQKAPAQPFPPPTAGGAPGVFAAAVAGRRPQQAAVPRDLEKTLEDALKAEPDNFTRT